MSASTQHRALNLARLPPELVEEIAVHAGVDACAALRHLRALCLTLTAYVRAGNYSDSHEQAMLKTLVDCHWSAGVQAMIDADIRHPFSRIVELDWNGIVLPASSIRKVYLWCFAAGRRDIARELLAVLTYNRINAGADCADLLQWGVRQVPHFASNLSSQYIKHDRNLDQLRAMHQELGVYLYERSLAKTLLPLAAQHGRLELVQTLDLINPEVLQEHSDVITLAAENGHLQIVQYAYSRLLPALPQEVLEIAMEQGHERVARWLYGRCPQAIGWRAFLGMAENGHIELWQQVHGHLQYTTPRYSERDEWWNRADAIVVVSEDAWVRQTVRQIDPTFSAIDAVARYASRASLPALQHAIQDESSTPNPQVFCAAASAGRTDIVDWMLAECPRWTTPEAVQYAAGAGHQDLAQRLSDHFGVPLKDCRLEPHHLQALVDNADLQKLKWIEKHYTLSCDEGLLLSRIKSRNLAVAQLLHRHCQDIQFTSKMLTEACRSGNLRMVQWVYRHLPESVRPADAIDVAAECGFELIVEWLHHNTSLPCTTWAMNSAALAGRLDIVCFLQEHRTEGCTGDAAATAVLAGHLDIADYLRINRHQRCGTSTLEMAVSPDRTLATVRWITTHYPEQLTERVLNIAAMGSQTGAVEYFHTLPNAPFSPTTMDSAATAGNIDFVRWLHANRTEGCTARAMKKAARGGYLSVVKFLHENDYPMCEWDDIERSPSYIQAWWRSIQA
ncbi:hypothetical protein RI367_005303, partial [Sorochytrium milnesiophthora]